MEEPGSASDPLSDSHEKVIRLLAKGYACALLAKAGEKASSPPTSSQEVITGMSATSPAVERMESSEDRVAAAKDRIALEFVMHNIPIGEWRHDLARGTWTLSYRKEELAVLCGSDQEMEDIAGGGPVSDS